jgi:hypothetical protein
VLAPTDARCAAPLLEAVQTKDAVPALPRVAQAERGVLQAPDAAALPDVQPARARGLSSADRHWLRQRRQWQPLRQSKRISQSNAVTLTCPPPCGLPSHLSGAVFCFR